MLILYIITTKTVLAGFNNLQEEDVRKDISRAINVLDQYRANLDNLCQDLAFKTDTAIYVNHPDKSYIDANFSDSTFEKLNINFALLLDASHLVLFEKAFDIGSRRPMQFPAFITGDGNINLHFDRILASRNGESGIIILPESPAFFSIWPVMQDGKDDPIGFIALGRYLDSYQVLSLAQTANLYHFNVYRVSQAESQPDLKTVLPELKNGILSPIRYLNDGFIAGYSFVKDIDGSPALIIKVDKPSSIYQAGQNNAKALLLLLLGSGIVFVILIILLIDRLVLSRLFRLKKEVANIKLDGQSDQSITVSGHDELSDVSETINQMIERIECSQDALKKSSEELQDLLSGRAKITASFGGTN